MNKKKRSQSYWRTRIATLVGKAGVTLIEVLVSLTILGILIGGISLGVGRIARQAYLTRANDTADVAFIALQTALTQLKTEGRFDEVFSEDKRGGDILNPQPGEMFFDVPELAIKGKTFGDGSVVPGVVDRDGNPLDPTDVDNLLAKKNLVYMRLNKNDLLSPNSESELFYQLIEPFLADKEILKYSLLAEVNLNNKTVRAVFYSEKAGILNYELNDESKASLLKNENVLLRDRVSLDEKMQGYSGSLGIGEEDSIKEVEDPFLKVYNDDLLMIEWRDTLPTSTTMTEAQKLEFMSKLKYTISIVNANDTTQKFLVVKDVTAYNSGEAYINKGITQILSGTSPRSPMPIYDVFDYASVSNITKSNLMVPFETDALKPDGTMETKTDFKHRISYYRPNDIGGNTQYGYYRLVLDSITTAGLEDLSISKVYPSIPWNSNFRVLVEATYDGEGFTGSENMAPGEHNAYTNLKIITNEVGAAGSGEYKTSDIRGVGTVKEFLNYIFGKTAQPENIWYEVGYSRHLNNLRYIAGDADTSKKGDSQNILLVNNIDWSLQRIGNQPGDDYFDPMDDLHRLTVSNAEGNDLTTKDPDQLRIFSPITTGPTDLVGVKGFSGIIQSNIKRESDGSVAYLKDGSGNPILNGTEKIPLFNQYQISYLKIAALDGNGAIVNQDDVGLFDQLSQRAEIKDITFSGAAILGKNYVGTLAGKFFGRAEHVSITSDNSVHFHKKIVYNSSGVMSEATASTLDLKPYNLSAGGFKGNTVLATEDFAGGLIGKLFLGSATPIAGKTPGVLHDISNGTRFKDVYTTPNIILNGLAVQSKNYSGGIAGSLDSNVILTKVANSGNVTAIEKFAGGIAGDAPKNVIINGVDELAFRVEDQFVTRTYTYIFAGMIKIETTQATSNNYGYIKAKEFAGGIVGQGVGGNGELVLLSNLKNSGQAEAIDAFAGGIVGYAEKYVNIFNASNMGDVSATKLAGGNYSGLYAGGIAGKIANNVRLEAVQNLRNVGFSRITDMPSGVSAGYYAGGIVGYADDQAIVKPGKLSVSLGTIPANTWILLSNAGNVTARGNDSDSPKNGAYAGGIAGFLDSEVQINNDMALPFTPFIAVNEGNITAEQGSHAGGIAGVIVSNRVIVSDTFNKGPIKAAANYAGGLVGEIDATVNNANDFIVRHNQEILDSTVIPTDINLPVRYTNMGTVEANNFAGGIVGRSIAPIKNVFNIGAIQAATDSAGGILGAYIYENGPDLAYFNDQIVTDRIANRAKFSNISLNPKTIFTNRGAVYAGGSNAGGVVGLVEGKQNHEIQFFDLINNLNEENATVSTGKSIKAKNNAGGWIGSGDFVELFNKPENISLFLNSSIRTSPFIPVRNNQEAAVVTHSAGNNAGGIIGYAQNSSIYNVFNASHVGASGSNAGGLVGQGSEVEIYNTQPIIDLIFSKRISNNQIPSRPIQAGITVSTTTGNAGGIIGLADKSTVVNTFNQSYVLSVNASGGIVGRAKNDTVVNHTESVASAVLDNNFFTNYGRTETSQSNSGGIVGLAEPTTKVYDVFNRGYVVARINAGGLIGYMQNDSHLFHTDTIAYKVIDTRKFSNQSNVLATYVNAGGVVGKLEGRDSDVLDVYNGDGTTLGQSASFSVRANYYNAGGVIGRLIDAKVSNARTVEQAIDNGIYTNNISVYAPWFAGGIVGTADNRSFADDRAGSSNYINLIRDNHVGFGLDTNDFYIHDVYNIGYVSGNYSIGGIFGFAGAGKYENNPALVNRLISKDMFTNKGSVYSAYWAGGGIFGMVGEKLKTTGGSAPIHYMDSHGDVMDVFNQGSVSGGYMLGGIAGKAIKLDLKYTESVLRNSMNISDKNNFLFTNTNTVTGVGYIGGVVGHGTNSILQDTFNSGTAAGFVAARDTDNSFRIRGSGDYIGGLVGYGQQISIVYSDLVTAEIKNDPDYVYSNMANITGRSQVGGIIGAAEIGVQLVDTFNMGKVEGINNVNDVNQIRNIGGIAGLITVKNVNARGASYPIGSITDLNGELWKGIDLEDNLVNVRTTGGTEDLAYGKNVAYITYSTIVSDPTWTTNRYSNQPKNKTIADESFYNVSGNAHVGGIVGQIDNRIIHSSVHNVNIKNVRIENAFNAGATSASGQEIAGVRASFNSAGGVVGYSTKGVISYSFPINPGSSNLATDNKGDHSTFAEAFNDLEVRKDPYAVVMGGNLVPLHMVPNTAFVRASQFDPGQSQNSFASINFSNGQPTSAQYHSAGGVVGNANGGYIHRAYSVQGNVFSPQYVGGIVGQASSYAMIKQVSRLDGHAINAHTMIDPLNPDNILQRGAINVGGIVGYLSASKVLDARNFTEIKGRTNVGGIVGLSVNPSGTMGESEISLVQNIMPVTGFTYTAKDREALGLSLDYTHYTLDKSSVDGSYIGGILGRGDEYTTLVMTKNDPLITDEFEELQTEVVSGVKKFVRGGNPENLVSGREYVGGINGYYGVITYSINTGRVHGNRNIGGISGVGYRITNSFNTGNVEANNSRLYLQENNPTFEEAVHVGGITGVLGKRSHSIGLTQIATPGSYIQSVFNSSEIVRGSSFVGGIAGLAVAPIDTVYNKAVVSGRQSDNETGEVIRVGNKIGGIIGVLTQDSSVTNPKIILTNSYNSGQIVGSPQFGSLVGNLEGAGAELILSKRLSNSYYLSDNSVKYWDSTTAQTYTEINYGLKPLTLNESFNLNTFINPTTMLKKDGTVFASGDNINQKLADTEYGLRNYVNMITKYTKITSAALGLGYDPKGVENLKNPLNANAISTSRLNVSLSSSNLQQTNSKFKYPIEDAELELGRDYEFPHIDFSGDSYNDQEGMASLTFNHAFLPGNNQTFNSEDKTLVSNFYNYWPTKVIDYMAVKIAYDAGESADTSNYTDGIFVSDNTAVNKPEVQFNPNTKAPTYATTKEKLHLYAAFQKQVVNGSLALPKFIHFEVYDGHSRGYYNYNNQEFRLKYVLSSALRIYTLVKDSEISGAEALPAKSKEVFIEGEKYHFYVSGSADGMNPQSDAVFNALADSVIVTSTASNITVEFSLDSREMDSYMAATTGYYTFEAHKVYDLGDGIPQENLDAKTRTSRMFSMHFSNKGIIPEVKNGVIQATPVSSSNNSILDEIPSLNFDDFSTMTYATTTAALGSVRLKEAVGSTAANPLYQEAVRNSLKITNERHLYNMNKNNSMGYSGIGSSYLPYITKSVELLNNIQMSTHEDHNGFVIGSSNGQYYRMTGSLQGNGFTIGNVKVNRLTYPNTFGADDNMPIKDYGFIYELSGGVVKGLHIGSDSKIVAQNVGGLTYVVSNGRTSTDDKDVNNIFYENLSPELPLEVGVDAKIYNTFVHAQIQGTRAGGFAAYTGRRFKNNADRYNATKVISLTATDSVFAGSINAISSDPHFANGNGMAASSLYGAGFLPTINGKGRTDDVAISGSGPVYYATEVYINGSSVAKDAYIYGMDIAAGFVGQADYTSSNRIVQKAFITKSINNGAIISMRQASGISNGIERTNSRTDTAQNASCSILSKVEVNYVYNNGIVQTPSGTGLASGIGNNIPVISNAINNGTVLGSIASGITNYSDKHIKITTSSNNGYVQGSRIAGGIIATPSYFNGSTAILDPYIYVKLEDVFNTGTVVVTSNTDSLKAVSNSYAGGILGYATSDPDINWKTIDPNTITAGDERFTIIKNTYNAGLVYYLEGNQISFNSKNIGGILGGGLHRFVNTTNSYSLLDPEARIGGIVLGQRLDINFGNYGGTATNQAKINVDMNQPADLVGYNYKLTPVGNSTYGKNVTNMSYLDMRQIGNFVGFNETNDAWVTSTTSDVNGKVYPFPQFKHNQVNPLYVGDVNLANKPSFVYNINLSAPHLVPINTPANAINTASVTKKIPMNTTVSYSQNTDTVLAPDGTNVNIIKDSNYAVEFSGYSAAQEYDINIFDGDPYATGYAAAWYKNYLVRGGNVSSNSRMLHSGNIVDTPLTYFDPANVAFVNGKLTFSDKEVSSWPMPINGYYTILITRRNPGNPDNLNLDDSSVQGIQKSVVKSSVSSRFNAHFGGVEVAGSNIMPNSGVYDYGTEAKPFRVTDQYSIIGMTTSGIAVKSTDGRYYLQSKDIVIDEPFYGMFEFNGFYNGTKNSINKYPNTAPIASTNFSIYYGQANNPKQDFGFISYLRTLPTSTPGFKATVSNVNVYANAENGYAQRAGKYLEAVNYVANLGVIADYLESAVVDGVTVEGKVILKGYHNLADRPGFINNINTLAGVAAFSRNSEIKNTKNNARIGVDYSMGSQNLVIGGSSISVPVRNHQGLAVEVGGITALANNTKLTNVVNNGEVIASSARKAAGIVHTMENNTSLERVANSGWVQTQNGTAAGLVAVMSNGTVTNAYNSGKVTGQSFNGNGIAAGGFGDIYGGSIRQFYNSGVIVGKKQGAIAVNSSAKVFMTNVNYLKDDAIYWADPWNLPGYPDLNVTNVDDITSYLGFSYIPVEVWPFTDDTNTTYQVVAPDPANGIVGVYNDPYALKYSEMKDPTLMATKGYVFNSAEWMLDTTSTNPTMPASGNQLLRDYGQDPYPLPQFNMYRHLDRNHQNFPIFLGESARVGKVPYAGITDKLDYVEFVRGVDTDETFKDTIQTDINDVKRIARHNILVFNGVADLSRNPAGNYIKTPTINFNVVKRYIDPRNIGSIDVSAVENPANKQYSKIYLTNDGAYFFEIEPMLINGALIRPAVFEKKDFLADNKVNVIFNNDLLDLIPEPSEMANPFYSVTVLEYQPVDQNETTDLNNFYSKFSPHFADAITTQAEVWDYGTQAKPYFVSTQRNLANIALGGNLPGATDSHYLLSHFVQTQNIKLTNQKEPVAVAGLTVHKDLWVRGVGTSTIPFSGSYSGFTSGNADQKWTIEDYRLFNVPTKGLKFALFNRVAESGQVSDIHFRMVQNGNNPFYVEDAASSILISENSGTVKNIKMTGVSNSSKAIRPYSASNSFGFVVGKAIQTGAPVVVENIEIVGQHIVYNFMPGANASLGSVIGSAEGSLTLKNIKTNTYLDEQSSRMNRSMGGVVGRVVANAAGSDLTMENITSEGYLYSSGTSNYPVGNVGGLVGNTSDMNVNLMGSILARNSIYLRSNLINLTYNVDVGGLIGLIENPTSRKNVSMMGTWIGDPETTNSSLNSSVTIAMDNLRVVANVSGLVGRVVNANVTVDQVAVNNSIRYHTGMFQTWDKSSTVAGLFANLDNTTTSITNSRFKGSITTSNSILNQGGIAGGIIGKSNNSDVSLDNVVAGTYNHVTNRPTSSMTYKNRALNNADKTYVGGLVGVAVSPNAQNPAPTLRIVNSKNYSDIFANNFVEGSSLGGLVGKVENVAFDMETSINLGKIEAYDVAEIGGALGSSEKSTINMKAVANDGELRITGMSSPRYKIGGLVGGLRNSIVNMLDTDITDQSNLINRGPINITLAKTAPVSTAFLAGGIGYTEKTDLTVFGLRSTASILSAMENPRANVVMAGVLAYGITDIGSGDPSIKISHSLNENSIKDARKDLDNALVLQGVSKVGGIVGEIYDNKNGSTIEFNHNAGALKAGTVAGIVHSVAYDPSTSNSNLAQYLAKTSLKYNLNVGLLDAFDSYVNAFNITSSWQIPVVNDGTNDLNGEDGLTHYASIVRFYNVALEDMIRPEKTAGDPAAITIDSKILSLAELQNFDVFKILTGWDDTLISKDLDDQTTAWIMETGNDGTDPLQPIDPNEYLLPRLQENAYYHKDGMAYLNKASSITAVTATPIVIGVETFDAYQMDWTYDSSFDPAVDRFAIVMEENGQIVKVLYPDSTLVTQVGNTFSFHLRPEYTADITNTWTSGEEKAFDVSVAILKDNNSRKMRSFIAQRISGQNGSVILSATNAMTEVSLAFTRSFAPINFSMLNVDYHQLPYSEAGLAVVAYAKTRIGDPYSMPLAGQGAYLDCSYLVLKAYEQIGIKLPRVAAWQAEYLYNNGLTIAKEDLMPGDLVFWTYKENGDFLNITHVGIYAGDGMVIDASFSLNKVVYRPMFGEDKQVMYARPYATPNFLENYVYNVPEEPTPIETDPTETSESTDATDIDFTVPTSEVTLTSEATSSTVESSSDIVSSESSGSSSNEDSSDASSSLLPPPSDTVVLNPTTAGNTGSTSTGIPETSIMSNSANSENSSNSTNGGEPSGGGNSHDVPETAAG